MKAVQSVIDWWRVRGKVSTTYILLGFLVLSPFIRLFPPIAAKLPDGKYDVALIAAALLLILQIQMALFKGDHDGVTLRSFEDSSDDFKKRVGSVKRLDILCSTSETFYPILKDLLAERKIECRLLLRHPMKGSRRQLEHLQHYVAAYEDIKKDNTECRLSIRFCTNTFSRLIILDNTEAYFGFYLRDGARLRARDLEMIHVRSGSHLGNFILSISRNRFDSMWESAQPTIGERQNLVY